MTNFVIAINVDNDAFLEGQMGKELNRILKELGFDLEEGQGYIPDVTILHDSNGDAVGSARLKKNQRRHPK